MFIRCIIQSVADIRRRSPRALLIVVGLALFIYPQSTVPAHSDDQDLNSRTNDQVNVLTVDADSSARMEAGVTKPHSFARANVPAKSNSAMDPKGTGAVALQVAGSNPGLPFSAPEGSFSSAQASGQYEFVEMWRPEFEQWLFLDTPYGVAVDPDGYIYVADTENHRVHRLTSEGVPVSQWGSEGDGAGEFDCPYGIAVDQEGYVYVADTFNDRVQKFTSSGGHVVSWGTKGDGQGEFAGLSGIAVGPDGHLYVADFANDRIQKFTPDGTFVSEWGSHGQAEGEFQFAWDVAVDQEGYVYVADAYNNRIQKFTLEGTFVSEWGSYGTAEGEFSVPRGVAVDHDGYVYVADTNNNRIQKFTLEGTFVAEWGSEGDGEGELDWPASVAVGEDGYVYVADTYNSRIQKFISDGTFTCTWGRTYPQQTATIYYDEHAREDYAVGRFGALLEEYVYDGAKRDRILHYPDEDLFYYALGYYIYNSGLIREHYSGERIDHIDWCPDPDDTERCYTVRRYIYDGLKLERVVVYYPEDDLYYPDKEHEQATIAVAADEDAYVHAAIQDLDSRSIQRFTSDGDLVTEWNGGEHNAPFSYWALADVAMGPDAHIYVADGYSDTEFDDYGNPVVRYIRFRVQRFDSDGNLIADWELSFVVEVSPDIRYWEGDDLASSAAIAVDKDGYAYIAVAAANGIWKFDPDGEPVTDWGGEGDGPGGFSRPEGIAVDPDGYVYVTDSGNHRVQKFTSDGTFVAEWGSEGDGEGEFNRPFGIAVDQDSCIYVTELEGNRVQKFTADGGFVTKWGSEGDGDGEFSGPDGIAVDRNGYVYVMDSGNYRIQKFTLESVHHIYLPLVLRQ